MKKLKIERIFLFVGIVLLGLNLIGLFIPLRNSDIYLEKKTNFEDDIVLTEKQLLKILKRNNESDEIFITKANEAISKGIAHYWKEEGINKYNIRIPIYENYILYIASYLYPSKFEMYEFYNYHKAIERGVGLCSQHAIILSEVLENNGIDCKILTLKCHVVTMAQINKENKTWWVLDPDFGVIIKNNINEIKKSPEIIQPYYADKGYDSITIDLITDCYRHIENIYEEAIDYNWKKNYTERLTYLGIWIIPLILIIPSIIVIVKK